jgi:hypothetical protein
MCAACLIHQRHYQICAWNRELDINLPRPWPRTQGTPRFLLTLESTPPWILFTIIRTLKPNQFTRVWNLYITHQRHGTPLATSTTRHRLHHNPFSIIRFHRMPPPLRVRIHFHKMTWLRFHSTPTANLVLEIPQCRTQYAGLTCES